MDSLVWFGLVLWHINRCRLSNTKSIFIHINTSNSINSTQYKYSFCLHSSIYKVQFSISTVSMPQTFLFQTIQFSIHKQFHFKYFNLAEVHNSNVKTVNSKQFSLTNSSLNV